MTVNSSIFGNPDSQTWNIYSKEQLSVLGMLHVFR